MFSSQNIPLWIQPIISLSYRRNNSESIVDSWIEQDVDLASYRIQWMPWCTRVSKINFFSFSTYQTINSIDYFILVNSGQLWACAVAVTSKRQKQVAPDVFGIFFTDCFEFLVFFWSLKLASTGTLRVSVIRGRVA